MKATVSLWSADQLALGAAVDALDAVADGFHVDVMDGRFAPGLLFGPDTVRALAGRAARAPVDVHLMVEDADRWIDEFADAGAEMLTVHPEACADPAATLRRIAARGVRPGIALTAGRPLDAVLYHLEYVDRILVMGTAIGVKGVDVDAGVYARVRALAAAPARPEIFVDGGIRAHTVPRLAAAGADGVVPGSLVFGARDWREAVRAIHAEASPA